MSTLYITTPGDTLLKLTEMYYTSFKDIEKLNDIVKLKLIKNQMIFIPLPHDTSIKLYQYKTKAEDTLEVIIDQYSVDYEEIRYFNNLMNLILEENQKITIENKLISPVNNEFENEE